MAPPVITKWPSYPGSFRGAVGVGPDGPVHSFFAQFEITQGGESIVYN